MKVQRNFSLIELSCPCGICTPIINRMFIDRLQCLRDVFGKPIVINSWYRCRVYNAKIGGAENSQHTRGVAADISVKGLTSEEKFELINLAYRFGFKGIAQGSTFIHLDLRESATATWIY